MKSDTLLFDNQIHQNRIIFYIFFYPQSFFSSSSSMLINMGGKFTDVKRSLIKILQSYKNIRNLIQKLTRKSPKHLNDVQMLIREVNEVRKVSQREIKHYAELQLISQVEIMLKNYIQKSSIKIKRFEVYSHVLCYLDVLASKISLFLPRNMQIFTLTPEMMKWKLFLSQINENKQFLNSWLKSQSIQNGLKNQNHQKSKSLYKFSTCQTKANTPTTNYSCNQSLAGEFVQFEPKTQTKQSIRHSFLKRCQTAKPQIKNSQKKNYPINVRSPSAKQYIKPQSAKQSQHHRKLTRKLTRKPLKTKTLFKPQIQPILQFDGGIEIIQLRQNNLQTSKVQPKAVKEKEPHQRKPFYEFTSKETFQDQKQQQATVEHQEKSFQASTLPHHKAIDPKSQRRSSMRKIKNFSQTQTLKSTFSKQNFAERLEAASETSNNEEEEQQIIAQEMNSSDRERKNQDTKRGRNFMNGTQNDGINQQKQNKQPQNQDQFHKKKLLTKNHKDSIPRRLKNRSSLQEDTPILERKSKRAHRRIGMISSKEIVSALKRIQTQQMEQEKEKQLDLKKKAIQFNRNLISQTQNGDEQITSLEDENELTFHPVNCSKAHQFYRELNRLKTDQANAAKQAALGSESIFFIKQDLLREQKSRQLQKYLQKTKAKHTSMGSIFELRSEETNKKVDNYMVVERRFAFEAESEWIKMNLECDRIRESQNEGQLVQQESRESWSVNEVDEI